MHYLYDSFFTYCMAIHKLSIDEFEDDDFTLVAIHTSVESYQVAFSINKHFPVLMHLHRDPVLLKAGSHEFAFSRYCWDDENSGEQWDLVENQSEAAISDAASGNLFFSEITQVVHLIPEFKKVDFFLKIQNYPHNIDSVLVGLQRIDKITAAYQVDDSRLKSKSNLIF